MFMPHSVRCRTALGGLATVALLAACSGTVPTAPSGTTSVTSQPPAFIVVPPPERIPLFVVGDVEAHDVGDLVNFWGAQWWKNNTMSGDVGNGVAAFKGFASSADNFCGGAWSSNPGNSSNPPAAIDADIAIIVTSKVLKSGPNISGDIQQILVVHQDGGYGPNPGHPGNGTVTSVACP